ncbi:sigma factor binding protein 2, chloroplastic-like isoform X2 [Cucurbita maxima]|uniref:Sigma factor binding protein 2, chloroplastic-like isoform X2 n=1 Tax=Cucurbita maxima TaxID=3661 RepID=A0A6J1HWH9_CUCMA|nr:sigma factor binding protein 2, chloroplastic-like isoform X2 [Cucurbita maxima]
MDGSAGTGTGNSHRLLDGVHRRKPTKKTKQPNKNKPIKVVYISNPMKVQISASGFMALVQQLTGQDAEFPDSSKFPPAAAFPDIHDTTADANLMMNNNPSLTVEPPMEDDPLLGTFYDDIDDLIFPPPVIGNYPALLPAAAATAVLYESYARVISASWGKD